MKDIIEIYKHGFVICIVLYVILAFLPRVKGATKWTLLRVVVWFCLCLFFSMFWPLYVIVAALGIKSKWKGPLNIDEK